MELNTVIFDMDGLLIDSEPLWGKAAEAYFDEHNIRLTKQQYALTTGMRTKEFLQYWFTHFGLPGEALAEAEQRIVQHVVELVKKQGEPMPGATYIVDFFRSRGFRTGLATSSGPALIDVVINKLGIRHQLEAIASAEGLPYGKPHPQVYLDCAGKLDSNPRQCICFEDSFNGMIAAKSAGMKCIIVPEPASFSRAAWAAADKKLSSLLDFDEAVLEELVPAGKQDISG